MGCVVGLLAGKGTIARVAILALVVCGGAAGFLVAWEHKWLKGPRAELRVTVTIFLMMGLAIWVMWPPHGIGVTPKIVTYDPNDTSQNYTFTIKNNEEETIYAAETKFKIDSPNLTSSDFQVYVPLSSLKPMYERSAFSDICGMFATDKQNKPLIVVQIFYLAPHETRQISLTHMKAGEATVHAIPSVFQATPQPRMADPSRQKCTYYAPGEEIVFRGGFIVSMTGQEIVIPDSPK